MEGKEPIEITKLSRKQALLIAKYESDSDIPDSGDAEVENNKANQLEEKESAEIIELPRKYALLIPK